MGEIRQKMQVKWRMEGRSVSHAHSEISIRGLTSQIDEPLERGGTNLGFTPD